MPRPTQYNADEDKVLLEWIAIPSNKLNFCLNHTAAAKDATAFLREAEVSPLTIKRTFEGVKKRIEFLLAKTNGI
jgi:hypothetical protein